MTRDATVAADGSPPVAGIAGGEWAALVHAGQIDHVIHADDVTHVLRDVELSTDTLLVVTGSLHDLGIEVDETVDDDETVEVARAADADAEWLSARRRARGRKPRGARGDNSTSDSVRMYLRSIGQVDLLSGEDERRLAQMIETGHQAAERIEAESQRGLQATRLRRAVERGESAKSELTQANLRLVVSIAKRYSGRGMHLLDLIQEGNLGLMRAVDKFDHTKGFKFSTYATWWIRQAITRSIADQSRTIRIPVHMVEHMNRVTRARRQMHQELEREPTIDEMAVRLQLEPDRVRELLRMAQDPLSLDSPVGDEDASNLGDFIQDESADEPSDAATRAMLAKVVEDVLDDLSPREQEIVRMRFGLDGNRAQTLEEVGKAFGVTRERIRQIEVKTLAKLRQPVRAQRLREFLEME